MTVKQLDDLIQQIENQPDKKEFSVCLEINSMVELCRELGVQPGKTIPYKNITVKLLQRF